MEMVDEETVQDPSWMLYVDGALSIKGCGVGVILEIEGDIWLSCRSNLIF